jgi:hypothetical protein
MTVRAFRPGAGVPETGVYRCNGECEHTYDVRGNRFPHYFPPLPDACAGSAWVLKISFHAAWLDRQEQHLLPPSP